MGDYFRGLCPPDAPGHFNNDTGRHTDEMNDGRIPQGLFLYNQQHPYRGEERQTFAVQEDTVFGQARFVVVDNQDVDADGSESMHCINIQQPASTSDHQEQNLQPVAPTAASVVPVPAVQGNRSSNPHFGVTGVQVQNLSLPDRSTVPQQVSDPTAFTEIAYPPSRQNQTQQNVRAECTVDFSPDGEREEERLPAGVSRSTSNDGSQYRTSSSASTVYRTAAWAGASQGGGDVDSHSANMNRFGAAAQRRVCHPRYSSSEARFSSFHRMTVELAQTVKSLTEAGLFFTGYKDTCRCFYCDGELHSWKPEDDPWLEHARHYPNCGHVKQKKGQEYIDLVKLAFSPSQEETEVKEIGACKPDFQDRDAIITTVAEMGYGRDKILKAWKQYQTKVNAGKIPRVPDPTNEILDIVENLPDQKTSASQGPRQNSSRGNAVNRFDYTLCCACNSRKAVVSQKECGHVVCTRCAPSRCDREKAPQCGFCGRQVIATYPIDLF